MNNDNSQVENIIKNLLEKSRRQNNQYLLFGDTYVYIQDSLPENVDINEVFDFIHSKMPQHLFSEVDAIYVGEFKELQDRQVQAMYKDGAIYVTNFQSNVMDMVDDIIHEIAHSIEEPYGMLIYADGQVESEFIGKRIRLRDLLKANGYDVDDIDFSESDFKQNFDDYLYQDIGYPVLTSLSYGLYTNPYAATSLREYFASGFEEYIFGDRELLKSISPALFNKIQEIVLDG